MQISEQNFSNILESKRKLINTLDKTLSIACHAKSRKTNQLQLDLILSLIQGLDIDHIHSIAFHWSFVKKIAKPQIKMITFSANNQHEPYGKRKTSRNIYLNTNLAKHNPMSHGHPTLKTNVCACDAHFTEFPSLGVEGKV